MRPAPIYESNYIQSYDLINAEKTLAGRFLLKSHSLLEKLLPCQRIYDDLIEVGAGTGHHVNYVVKNYRKYVMTDGNDEMLEIAARKYSSQIADGSLIIKKVDARALDYPDNSFDRLIATHVLEHLLNPVDVLVEWNRVVRPGGLISLVLPCDPGILWRFGRHFGPRRNAQNANIAYDYLQADEHVNSIFNLIVFIKHHFESIEESWYPFRLPVPDLNLFYVCHLRVS